MIVLLFLFKISKWKQTTSSDPYDLFQESSAMFLNGSNPPNTIYKQDTLMNILWKHIDTHEVFGHIVSGKNIYEKILTLTKNVYIKKVLRTISPEGVNLLFWSFDL